jgi:hypothetical protein
MNQYLRLIFLLSASLCFGNEPPQSQPEEGVKTSHSIELEGVLTSGIAYRYSYNENNMTLGGGYKTLGVGYKREPDKPDFFLNYQAFLGEYPFDLIFYRSMQLRGKAEIDGLGNVKVLSHGYYIGIGSWFKSKITENFYIPVSFGIDYPLVKESRFESDAVDDQVTDNIKSFSVYVRLGAGYEF